MNTRKDVEEMQRIRVTDKKEITLQRKNRSNKIYDSTD